MKIRPVPIFLALLIAAPVAWLAVVYRQDPIPDAGIPLWLAEDRARRVSDLRYEIHLRIPARKTDPVTGRLAATFALHGADSPLAFDFAQPV